MQLPDGNLTSQSSCQCAVETEAGGYNGGGCSKALQHCPQTSSHAAPEGTAAQIGIPEAHLLCAAAAAVKSALSVTQLLLAAASHCVLLQGKAFLYHQLARLDALLTMYCRHL